MNDKPRFEISNHSGYDSKSMSAEIKEHSLGKTALEMCASKRFKSHLNINLISVRHEYGKDECKGYGKLKRSL